MNIFISISNIFYTERQGIVFKADHSNVVENFPKNSEDPIFMINNDEDIITLVKKVLIESEIYSDLIHKGKFEEFKKDHGDDHSFLIQACFENINLMIKTETILYSIKNMYLFKDSINQTLLASRYYHDDMNVVDILKELVLFSKVFKVENLFFDEKLNKLIKDRRISELRDQVLKNKFLSDNGEKLIKEVLIKNKYAFNDVDLDHIALTLKNENIINILFNFYSVIDLEDYKNSISSKFKSYSYIHKMLNEKDHYVVYCNQEKLICEKLSDEKYSYPTIMNSIDTEEKTFVIFSNEEEKKTELIFNMVTMSTKDGIKLMSKEELNELLSGRVKNSNECLKLINS